MSTPKTSEWTGGKGDELETLLAIGARATPVIRDEGAEPLVFLPATQKVESLARFCAPTRIKRAVTLLEAGSFIEYINRFKTADTLIFAKVDEDGATFTAMLDYHGAAPDLRPAYCDHSATFEAIYTPEWKIWTAHNRTPMPQVPFATFLEDNLPLFIEPKGADLLELVRALHGHKNARFNSAIRLDNGAYSVAYDEDVVVKSASSTHSGDLELPAIIKAGMAVFQGADAYEIPARLKTRVEDRRLWLFYETIALPKIVRESIMLLVRQISDGTKIVPLLGNP